MSDYNPDGRAVLVGSLPFADHREAFAIMMNHTPAIPAWVQLPALPGEGMIHQFANGLPALAQKGDRLVIDAAREDYPDELTAFYENYFECRQESGRLESSRFALCRESAGGFYTFVDAVGNIESKPSALKGQVTGPITAGIGLVDHEGRSIFYDATLRDVLTKHLALKALWQVKCLQRYELPVIIFFDEPGIVSFGSSAYISITREQVMAAMTEVITTVQQGGGLAGVHICANGDWSLAFEARPDIISFDAYSYFDRFILFAESIREFLAHGGILAWGIVPTANPEHIQRETAESLFETWCAHAGEIETLGVDKKTILAQALITPSCGTGSLAPEMSLRVLELTRELSELVRARYLK